MQDSEDWSTDAPALRIIGADFTLYGELDAYQSLTMTRRYSEPGAFEAVLPESNAAWTLLAPGRFMLAGDFCGLIERIKFDSGTDGDTVTISGAEASGLLRYRICLPAAGQAYDAITGTPGECMAALVTHNAISPADGARKLDIELGEILISGDSITVKARYDALNAQLTEIANDAGLGWRIDADLDAPAWRFCVYRGRDLSVDQPDTATNAPMIFSPQFDNMAASSYEWSIADTYNAAIVAGQGEGAARAIAKVYSESVTGAALRETFIDARDLADSASLPARGASKLRENAEVRSFDGSVAPAAASEYGARWRLGDIVTIRHDDWGAQMDARIVEVTQSYGSDGVRVDVKFGDAPVTLTGKMQRLMTGVQSEAKAQ